MALLHGYKLIGDFQTAGSGTARWCYAEKNCQPFFIKEFLKPAYPVDRDMLGEEVYAARLAACEAFVRRKERIYRALRETGTGSIVPVEDFFREGSRYYAVSERIMDHKLTGEEISSLSRENRMVLLRLLVWDLMSLQRLGLVHGDLKLDNVLLKLTGKGFVTLKLIDFDSCYFEDDPPVGEGIQGDAVYMAPETLLAILGEDVRLTHKADIFSLGILFHQLLTGELPAFDPACDYLNVAVMEDSPVTLAPALPDALRSLLTGMLRKDPADRPDYPEIFAALEPPRVPEPPKPAPVFPNPAEKKPEGKKGGYMHRLNSLD